MSGDPLIDLRSREDMRENYLDGLVGPSESETRRARLAKPAVPSVPTLGSGACWCGASFGHDWPDRGSGAPHPEAS